MAISVIGRAALLAGQLRDEVGQGTERGIARRLDGVDHVGQAVPFERLLDELGVRERVDPEVGREVGLGGDLAERDLDGVRADAAQLLEKFLGDRHGYASGH
jgi:hypothetical protein